MSTKIWIDDKMYLVDEPVREYVDELQAELDKHRWIPVEERLPEKQDMYDVSDGRRKWEHLWIKTLKCWRKDGSLHYESITHWRLRILPEQALKGE